eukprot:13628238-Heterocapsa_arctica.AAC.1
MSRFAKMENIKIEVHSHGYAMRIVNYDSDAEKNKSTIGLLWCNINKWGAQPNHYNLLHHIYEEAKQRRVPKHEGPRMRWKEAQQSPP